MAPPESPATGDSTSGSGNDVRSDANFGTTHWSVVLAAGPADDPAAGPALEALCRAYWYPVYAFLRRRGVPPVDAEDYTQGFFSHLLSRGVLSRARRERGRFRSFLLTCLNHYVADERDKARAQRRGGGEPVLSLDLAGADACYASDPGAAESADRLFDRRWAVTTMERALKRLETEEITAGRANEFERLQPFLIEAAGAGDYRTVAGPLGLSANAAAVAVHRLRRRFRDCVREEVAATVATPGDIAAEMQHLLEALRGC
jgi:DNA-directed RNA polymerase specialized sigma24 family protein